jgi:hypothetical protein
MATPVTNFGKVTVSTGYDASATSIVLTTGHGSRLPSTFPYPLAWWDATTYSDPADDPSREIVIVTNRVGDTLTVTRGGEGTSASTKNTGGKTYKMVLGITQAMWEALNTRALAQTFRGLRLQTHSDSDKAPFYVRLVHADAIVMSDGEEVTNWNDVDFYFLGANGIGGLDTGSYVASTWYEIHAMWNGTTKGLMGHRAKDYKLDTSYTTGEDASQGLRSAVDNSTIKVAQGLQFATAGPLEFIDVKLVKTGTPTGNYWFTLEANNAGVPSNTPLATSRKYAASRLTTTAGFVRIPFDTPYSVSAATQYHLVLQGDYAVSASNFISWRMDGSAGSYASGAKALFDSDTSTWTTDTDDDLIFKAYVTENDTSLTMPVGYRNALVGYVYINGSDQLNRFHQQDRHVSCGVDANWNIGSLATARYLLDLFAMLPPVPVTVQLDIVQNTGTADMALGQLTATDLSGVTAVTDITCVSLAASLSGGMPSISLGPYQGAMFHTTASTSVLYVGSFTF